MKKKIVLLLVTALLITMFLPVCASASTSATEPEKIIRVGWFPYPGNSETHNGRYTGYTYDYLMEIAKYIGWEYEFVENDFATCNEMLKNGEVDIVGGLTKSSEREKIYDFPQMSYGQTYTVLFTDSDSLLEPYDFESFEGMRVGVLKNTFTGQQFAQFAQDNAFSYSIVEFDSINTMNEALEAEQIDAGALASYTATNGEKIIAKFAPASIYIATTKGNSEVLAGLNRALNLIKINRLYFEAELYQKYYAEKENMELTEAEQAIVSASKETPVLVGVIDNCAPISYWNKKDNSCKGLVVEIFNTICKKTGLNVKYVPVDISQMKQAATSDGNSPQLVLGLSFMDGAEYDKDRYLSDTLLEVPLAIAAKAGQDIAWGEKSGTIAVVKDFATAHTYIEEKMPGSELIEYYTLEECMTAVANGTADATVDYQSSIIYLQQKPYFSELKLVPTDMENVNLRAVGYTEDVQSLLHIVDKGMSRISENELRALTLNSTMVNTYHMTVADIFYKYQAPMKVIGILLAAVIIALISLYYVKRKSSEKLATAYSQKKDALIEAQKASAAKGSFMSRMSHEIRTPLNAVIGYNTIARNEMTEARSDAERKQAEMKIMDCLTKSDIASRHLLTIINDVLDMSAIESGKINIVSERFDFKGLISSLTAIFYSQAKSKGVEFSVQFDAQMEEWLLGDQMRLNQILTNLLSNAIKFTQEGGKVTLFIHPETDVDCINLHFEVRDTGIGMSDDYMERIWTPFEQADSSISRRFGGTGLGLSITKTLVDLLKGSISLKSHEGEGTTFFVDISFARTEQPTESVMYDFSTINALIVDDDINTCDYIQLLLTRSGVRNSAVYSGAEAISAVESAVQENTPYTICLVDWRMPKMDGLETVKHIREIAGDELPIIVITAYDFSEIAEKAAEVGVNMFISKPLFQSSLFNLLANISGNHVVRNEKKITSYDFAGARILLAEDNEMNMEIACSILETAKLVVDSAWNGQEALEMFLSAPAGTYSAILMDVQMPIMDGYQATKEIRASEHPEAAAIPIIAMTAEAFAENVAESHAAGMNDHISKPIDLPALLQTLKKYIH